MNGQRLPTRRTMLRALAARDAEYDGVFVTAVRTTGIFCRPTCRAKTPRPENVTFFPTPREALLAGFRPCKRCRPLEPRGEVPAWLRGLLRAVDEDPSRRWRDADLRLLGLTPDRVRRWFRENHDMTFHAYSRARRLGRALGQIQLGDKVIDAALDHGYDSLSGFQEALRKLAGTSPKSVRTTVLMTRIPTPLGPMLAGAAGDKLCLLEFVDRRMLETQLTRITRLLGAALAPGEARPLTAAARALDRYFARKLTAFDLPLEMRGTPFQESVWRALLAIPYGETRSYADIARGVGQPTAVRAVARANGDNRMAIVIPCHRVIGSDGTLTGYGGGLWRKRRLLDLESGRSGQGLLFEPPPDDGER